MSCWRSGPCDDLCTGRVGVHAREVSGPPTS